MLNIIDLLNTKPSTITLHWGLIMLLPREALRHVTTGVCHILYDMDVTYLFMPLKRDRLGYDCLITITHHPLFNPICKDLKFGMPLLLAPSVKVMLNKSISTAVSARL